MGIKVLLFVSLAAAVLAAAPPEMTVSAQSDDLVGLSDEFADAARLAQWNRHDVVEGWPSQLETVDVDRTSAGELFMAPFTSVWWAGFRAPFLFKDVSGAFVVTTAVLAQGRTRDFPDEEGSLVGVMIRAPRAGTAETWKPEDENYISLTAGLASGPGGRGPALETTVTTRGRSPLEWRQGRRAGWVYLRIVRLGSNFILMHRFEGERWVFHHLETSGILGRAFGMRPGIVEYPGLPAVLQVGVTAMTDWNTIREKWNGLSAGEETFKAFNSTVVKPPDGRPDLRARFDYVWYRRPLVPASLHSRRVADLAEPELLSFLGD